MPELDGFEYDVERDRMRHDDENAIQAGWYWRFFYAQYMKKHLFWSFLSLSEKKDDFVTFRTDDGIVRTGHCMATWDSTKYK